MLYVFAFVTFFLCIWRITISEIKQKTPISILIIIVFPVITIVTFLLLFPQGYANEDSLKNEAKETYGLELVKKSDSNENEYIFNNPDLDSHEICKVEFIEEITNHPVELVSNGRDKEAEAVLICNGEEPEKVN